MKKITLLSVGLLFVANFIFTACRCIEIEHIEPSVSVTDITLNKSTLELVVGETETLIATVLPENATNKSVTWTSSNTAAATVNNSGMVTAVSVGTAVITATTADGNFTAVCEVTVIPVSVTGVTLNRNTLELYTGASETLVATVLPENATNKNVTWTSSNTAVATVNSNGTVTAVSAGTAIITVRTTDGNFTDVCVAE